MRRAGKSDLRAARSRLVFYHALLLGGIFVFWYLMTEPGLIAPFYFGDPTRAKFFFGQPLEVFKRIWIWFWSGSIYLHLGVTLIETLLAFAAGTLLGLGVGLWLALSPLASALADPYIKAMNAMPRVILAPIFAVWFGLGILSKVALGITLVFFIVFFNVYQGVKEVSPVVLNNARMLGASSRQLLRTVYVPSAMSWVFSSPKACGSEELVMIIRDILSMKGGTIFSMAPEATVAAAVGMMVKNDIGSLVVMEGGRMTGMVTFREVLKALDAQSGNLADLR